MQFFSIGLMSGTSLDGLDICYVQFIKNETWHYKILKTETIKYTEDWELKLKNAIKLNSEQLLELNVEYGFFLGKEVQKFIQKHNIENLDIISSHGHTVFHQPQKKFTLQIGDGRAIKIITQNPVIYDFRSQDVLMGGNGAPLVPIGDQLLFSEYDACLNLGGFSNISFIKNNQRIAFDISPVNIVLNSLAEKLGQKFDKDGNFSKQGNIIPELLNLLNTLDFYKKDPPKSLGIEWCNQHIFPLFKEFAPIDLLATCTEHISTQIATVLNKNSIKNVLVTGGGAYNSFLIEQIKQKTSTEVIIPTAPLIEFKEALIFAFMGILKMNNEINVLASATGSSNNHSSGIIA